MSVKYTIEPTTQEHRDYVFARLRAPDADTQRSVGISPEQALRLMGSGEMSFSGLADGVPFYLFGLSRATMLSSTGVVWGIGTDEIGKHSRCFLRESRRVIAFFLEHVTRLEAFIDARFKESVRWAEWLGYTVEGVDIHEASGVRFMKCFIERGASWH